MELKDVVLSVLSDIQNTEEEQKKANLTIEKNKKQEIKTKQVEYSVKNSEEEFLKKLKERVLVMFEGFSSPNNKDIEKKLDLTVNFLEYLLSLTDERLDAISKYKK
ncbi:MAG: hypothetical protein QG567_478 [Campylobacterota bacterium]|nr:hypothetical protein [Campylobacterota bacterium]